MSDGLILRIRTEALWSSLDKLKNILATAPDRRVDLNTLQGRFDTIRTQLKVAAESLNKVQIAIRFGIDPSTAEYAADVDKNLNDILKALEAGIRDIGSMRDKCFRCRE